MNIAFLQPEVPHYREEFFSYVRSKCKRMDIYVYNSFESTKKAGFNIDTAGLKHIGNVDVHNVLLYNPFSLLSRKYDTLVLMLHFAHITTWILLLTKWLHRKKIILWGQGISVKRYLRESVKPDCKLKWQIALADGIWTYEEPEAEQWKKIFPNKPIVALNNTLTGAEEMVEYRPTMSVEELKAKYEIKEKTVLIFCARFESNYRRTDLLVETLERLDKEEYGFIIIGAGKNKPDFSKYSNVHDFGAVYDTNVKRELFAIADIYYQPGWVGLSIVEAMAYGKPVFTFVRTEKTYQCVEYCYIKDVENGMIFRDMDDCIGRIKGVTGEEICRMGKNARMLVKDMLTPRMMAERAMSVIKGLKSKEIS